MDDRLVQVEEERKAALTEIENTIGGMIDNTDQHYQNQIDAAKEWAETQKQNQQEQTDFAIEQIEQQKDQTKKDYLKEQSGAYVDWQKQNNQYGVNAEQMAAAGLASSGYSESSKVSMYNTYQNRVATARESYDRAVLNYNNAIHEARLQNNSILAEIAYNALQKELELALAGFQYKNSLVMEKLAQKNQVNTRFDQKYRDVLDQINAERALAASAASGSSRSGGSSGGSSGGNGGSGSSSGKITNNKANDLIQKALNSTMGQKVTGGTNIVQKALNSAAGQTVTSSGGSSLKEFAKKY